MDIYTWNDFRFAFKEAKDGYLEATVGGKKTCRIILPGNESIKAEPDDIIRVSGDGSEVEIVKSKKKKEKKDASKDKEKGKEV